MNLLPRVVTLSATLAAVTASIAAADLPETVAEARALAAEKDLPVLMKVGTSW